MANFDFTWIDPENPQISIVLEAGLLLYENCMEDKTDLCAASHKPDVVQSLAHWEVSQAIQTRILSVLQEKYSWFQG